MKPQKPIRSKQPVVDARVQRHAPGHEGCLGMVQSERALRAADLELFAFGDLQTVAPCSQTIIEKDKADAKPRGRRKQMSSI